MTASSKYNCCVSMYQASWFCSYTLHANYVKYVIMAYGTPYVGMTLEKKWQAH